MEKEIDINDLSFNELDEDIRLELLKPNFVNPFDIPKGTVMMNPFTFEMMGGVKPDGIHIMHHVWSLKIYRKIEVKNGGVIRAWKVNDNNEHEEVLPHEDGTWSAELF